MCSSDLAQMAGIPVVSTDVGSVSEIVEDGKTGFLSSRENADLVAKIAPLIGSEKLRQEMGAAAKKRAESLFSADVMVKAHLRLYQELLGKVSR